ncbi:MAG TPA: dTDP-glucose 4,6-dehydratase [Candidatus Angelobacter sp.]|nr:dTDP-glucose 4,6-dehydratase [Candidatus Angelobacter sp.]
MKILITGGAGFIGSNFVHHILRNYPSDQVVVVDKLTYAGNLGNLGAALKDERLKFVRLDICEPAVADAARGCDAAVHFAAESHVDRSIEDASPFVRTNVEGTWRMVEACRKSGVSRFVHVSTDEVYGSQDDGRKFTETASLNPTSPYAASKAASDLMVLCAVKTHRFPAIVTRCTNNYGPFQFPEKFIPLMIAQAIAGKPLPVYGDGKNVRDWIHVADHCQALDLVLRKGREGEVYNIGGDCELENITVARKILGGLGRPETLLNFVTDRPAHDRRYALDCKKLKREFGWSPSRDFERGLAETIRWYQENTAWLDETRSGEYQKYFERHYLRREARAAQSVKSGT